ncbi:MAG: hypothetical protein KAI26_01865 [Nanoarchaeota archaeon]|nr:hypothetical protein [Nanoarchaeota archaeon]
MVLIAKRETINENPTRSIATFTKLGGFVSSAAGSSPIATTAPVIPAPLNCPSETIDMNLDKPGMLDNPRLARLANNKIKIIPDITYPLNPDIRRFAIFQHPLLILAI